MKFLSTEGRHVRREVAIEQLTTENGPPPSRVSSETTAIDRYLAGVMGATTVGLAYGAWLRFDSAQFVIGGLVALPAVLTGLMAMFFALRTWFGIPN
jgi:hypothetical protein